MVMAVNSPLRTRSRSLLAACLALRRSVLPLRCLMRFFATYRAFSLVFGYTFDLQFSPPLISCRVRPRVFLSLRGLGLQPSRPASARPFATRDESGAYSRAHLLDLALNLAPTHALRSFLPLPAMAFIYTVSRHGVRPDFFRSRKCVPPIMFSAESSPA